MANGSRKRPRSLVLRLIVHVPTALGVFITPLLLASCLTLLSAYVQAAGCQMQNIATVQIGTQGRVPVLAGRVNDYPLSAILDTGAAQTVLFGSFAKKTPLDMRIVDRVKSGGLGGLGETGRVHAEGISFGPLWQKNVDLNVIMSDRVGVDALLGVDVLFSKYDLELAMHDGQIRFFEPVDCADATLAYWDKSASVVPMTKVSVDDQRRLIALQVNGKPARALIDSGAQRSIVDANFARLIGILDDSLENSKKGSLVGAGPNALDFTVVSVKQIVIGNEIIRDTTITVAEILRATLDEPSFSPSRRRRERSFDMILGEDFLHSHRVLISISQERFYFSYLGGRVFAVN